MREHTDRRVAELSTSGEAQGFANARYSDGIAQLIADGGMFMTTSFRSMFHFSRWRKVSTVFLLFLALVQCVTALPASAETKEARVLPQLQREADQDPGKTFRVIVTRQGNKQSGDAKVKKKGGKKVKDLTHDAFVAELNGADLAGLGQDDGVKFVAPDAPVVFTGAVDKSKLADRNIRPPPMPLSFGARPRRSPARALASPSSTPASPRTCEISTLSATATPAVSSPGRSLAAIPTACPTAMATARWSPGSSPATPGTAPRPRSKASTSASRRKPT